jgi:hypothetical protein
MMTAVFLAMTLVSLTAVAGCEAGDPPPLLQLAEEQGNAHAEGAREAR